MRNVRGAEWNLLFSAADNDNGNIFYVSFDNFLLGAQGNVERVGNENYERGYLLLLHRRSATFARNADHYVDPLLFENRPGGL